MNIGCSFAKKYNNIDTRLVVYVIQEKNNIKANTYIYPGETILVPREVRYKWDNPPSFRL